MKEVKTLLRQLSDLGVECIRTASNHYKVYRDGRIVAVFPSTPSCPRGLKNTRARLRRAGIAV